MRTAPAPADLTETYQSLRQPLLAYLRRLLGDAQAAEDVLQDVILKTIAVLHDGSVTPPRDLSAWLYRLAHNAAMDHHRARRPTDSLDEELADTLAGPEADPEASGHALANCLRPLLTQLPESYREVLQATELEGRTLRDAALLSGISLDAAKQRASRGRRQLREQLLRCCEVALSAQGQVIDFSPRGKSCSAPCGGGSCSR